MPVALTRGVPRTLRACELTHLTREPIDVDRAAAQHEAYEAALAAAGCTVRRLPAAPELPDCVFVEDTAVVLEELAILARPGAPSRQGETTAVEPVLAEYRTLARIEAPGTLDGGDVLRVDRQLFVGESRRTNAEAIHQLRDLTAAVGYSVHAVPVRGCLHLKTAACALDDATLLINPDWIDLGPFSRLRLLAVDRAEPFAANALAVGSVIVHAEAFPRTREQLQKLGYDVMPVPADELAKAEAGVTCCSIIIAD